MKTYEVKFDADGQDFWEFEADSPKEAYESFLNEYNGDILEVPIVVWEGLEKVATYKSHIGGGSDQVKNKEPKSKESIDHKLQESVGSIGFSVQQLQKTQEETLKELKQINWGIRIGFLFIILVISGIIKPGIFG